LFLSSEVFMFAKYFEKHPEIGIGILAIAGVVAGLISRYCGQR